MDGLMKWLSDVFAPKARKVFANPWIDTVASTMKKVLPIILTGSLIPKQDTENTQNSLCPVSYKFTARLLHIKELLIQFSLIGSVGLDYILTSLFPWSLILNLNNGYAVSLKLL